MRLYVSLLVAISVLYARAATIPEQILPEIEKEIASEDVKIPIDTVSIEQELAEHTAIKDVQNNLRNNIAEVPVEIPVAVITEDVHPAFKTGVEVEAINEVSNEEIQRPLVDLKNPGPPQHQEHETQNPEHYEDAERKLAAAKEEIKEEIKETQTVLRHGFQDVTDEVLKNEHLSKIEASIQNMQETFTVHFQKLNELLQSFMKPENINSNANQQEASQTKSNFELVESRLKTLQENLDKGVQTLSKSVQDVESVREDGDKEGSSEGSSEKPATNSTTAATSTSAPPPNFLQNFATAFSNMQNSMISSMQNLSQAINQAFNINQNQGGIQNFFFPTTASSQSADGSTTTASPVFWQNFPQSITNMWNQDQGGPFQNFLNAFRPSWQTTEAPNNTESGSKPDESKPQENKPTEKPEEKPEGERKPPQLGPVQQAIQNNPIVQGINGIVQRFQTSINNPDKPRETEVKSETEQEKGLLFLPNKGHRPGGYGSGDNNDGGERVNAEEVKEIVTEEKAEEVKETIVEDKVEEVKETVADEIVEVKETEPVPEKTE